MSSFRHALKRLADDGKLYAILSACGFSMKAIFVKLGYAAAPVSALNLLTLRMGIALPFFLWLIHVGRHEARAPLRARDGLGIFLIALSGYYLSSLFDFTGLAYISTGLERMILFVYPTLVLLFQCALSRKRPERNVLQAMAICYVGLGIAFFHDLGLEGHGSKVMLGSAWVFAAAVTYALYYLGTGIMLKRIGSTTLAGYAGAISSVQVLLHFAVMGTPSQLPQLPASVWAYCAAMAIFSTVLPIYWLSIAIQRIGTAQTAAVGNLGPVLTILASWLVLGEPLSIAQVAGLALVLLGVSRLKSPKRPAPAAGEPASTRPQEA